MRTTMTDKRLVTLCGFLIPTVPLFGIMTIPFVDNQILVGLLTVLILVTPPIAASIALHVTFKR